MSGKLAPACLLEKREPQSWKEIHLLCPLFLRCHFVYLPGWQINSTHSCIRFFRAIRRHANPFGSQPSIFQNKIDDLLEDTNILQILVFLANNHNCGCVMQDYLKFQR